MNVTRPFDINAAVEAIEAGGLVVVPTSRWYMLCCDAANSEATRRIFAAKRRPPDKSLLLIVRSIQVARQHFHLTAEAERLAASFWPGDLALRLPWRDAEEARRHAAVGVPNALVSQPSGVLGEIANRAATFVAATSANISGDTNPTGLGPSITVEEVLDFVREADADVSVILDGGVCAAVNHMTIVDCSDESAGLIRTGGVHARAVGAVLGRDIATPATPLADGDEVGDAGIAQGGT